MITKKKSTIVALILSSKKEKIYVESSIYGKIKREALKASATLLSKLSPKTNNSQQGSL